MRHSASASTLIVTFAVCSFAVTVFSQGASISVKTPKKEASKSIAAVRALLGAQREAWNRGDLEGYMNGYARSPETVLVSGDNVMRGWQNVLERYQKSYNSREKMGKLTFSDLEISLLGKDVALVLGRWHLQRANDAPHGRFTLVLRQTKQGWRIVHDHTSVASQ